MEKNVGGYDRIARLAVGSLLVVLGRSMKRDARSDRRRRLTGRALSYLGSNLVFTALSQRCPVNSALGVNTCRQSPSDAMERAERVLEDRARSLVG